MMHFYASFLNILHSLHNSFDVFKKELHNTFLQSANKTIARASDTFQACKFNTFCLNLYFDFVKKNLKIVT